MRIVYEKGDMKPTERMLDGISSALIMGGLSSLAIGFVLVSFGFTAIGLVSASIFIFMCLGGLSLDEYVQAKIKERRSEEGYHDLMPPGGWPK